MRFWDASAIVPLLLEQPASEHARRRLDEDRELVVWWGTPVECASAFARLRREGVITPAEQAELGRRLEALRLGWYEVLPGDHLRAQAMRVLRLHPLRAADALQLAAALEWSDSPAAGVVVSFDERLSRAAVLEGFTVEGE